MRPLATIIRAAGFDTVAGFATHARIPEATIRKAIKTSNPRRATLAKLASALDLTPWALEKEWHRLEAELSLPESAREKGV